MDEIIDHEQYKTLPGALNFSDADTEELKFFSCNMIRRAHKITVGIMVAAFGSAFAGFLLPVITSMDQPLAYVLLLGPVAVIAGAIVRIINCLAIRAPEVFRGKIVRIRRNQPNGKNMSSFVDVWSETERQYAENFRFYGGKADSGDNVVVFKFKRYGKTDYMAAAEYLIRK